VKLGVTIAATQPARDFPSPHSRARSFLRVPLASVRPVPTTLGRLAGCLWPLPGDRTRLPRHGYRREWRWHPCDIFRVVATGTTIARRTLEKVGARLSVQCYGHHHMLAPEPKSGRTLWSKLALKNLHVFHYIFS
jgi:hypothetical protein